MRWLYADRRLAACASLLTLVSVGLSFGAAFLDTFPADRPVTRWVYGLGGWYSPLAELTNDYNLVIALGAGALAIVLLALRGDMASALLFVLAAGVRPLLTLAKSVVDRPRPMEFVLRDGYGDTSFPSGHVMTAMAVFGLWFLLAPRLVAPSLVVPVRALAAVAVLMHAVSRMWAGVHWFSDTYGAVIWMSAVLAVLLALRPGLEVLVQRVRRRE